MTGKERRVGSRFEVQLEKDGGGGTRQNWMDIGGLWPMFHWKRQGISQVSKAKYCMGFLAGVVLRAIAVAILRVCLSVCLSRVYVCMCVLYVCSV